MSRLLYGSISKDVVHRANCPVWKYILEM
ncbi:hypothetical protein ACFQ21_00755 [Ohtaekwangia kribbensis]|uniref:Uncharacterized protein n=1 Tax=Ohtaekwangia kribbensis TaxID=688913 RepID=A0ABW3JW49_9BACT